MSRRTVLTRLVHRVMAAPAPALHHCTRRIQTLAFEEIKASPDKPHQYTAMILHGLLGSARNWRSFSRSLAASLSPARQLSTKMTGMHLCYSDKICELLTETIGTNLYDYKFAQLNTQPNAFSEWRMVLVDLRNHGKSAELDGFLPPHNLENAAKDLANLVRSQGWDWPNVVVGHSMGGKVALQFAQSCANGDYGDIDGLPRQLWVLDSVPGQVSRDNSDGEVEKVLQTLQSLPSTLPSRKWLVDHMLQLGFSNSLSQWIGSNLKTSGKEVTWSFNLEGAAQMFHSYGEMDYWPLLENTPKGMEIAIVRAEKSDRWNADVIKQLNNISSRRVDETEGKVSFHVLPNAGHWVHVDNAKGLLEIIAPKVASLV